MLRHRKEAIDPTDKLAVWRLKYRKEHGDVPVRDKLPEGFDQERYDAFRDHDVFCTMVKAFIKNESIDIQGIIYTYWNLGFKRPFPKEGGSLLQLCTMIRLKLLKRGFERNDIDEDPEEYIKKRFPRLIPHKFFEYQIHSQPKEDVMAKKRDDDDRKDRKKKRSRDDDDDRKDRKKGKSKARDISAQCRLMCAELLLKRKYTDRDISKMIEEEVGAEYSPARVNRIREGINNGVRGDPPKPPLEEIVKGGKKKKSRDDDDDDDRKDRKKKDKKRRHRDDDDD